MTGHLAIGDACQGQMTKNQRAHGERCGKAAAEVARQLGVVVARDPDPVASASQRAQRGFVNRRHAPRTVAVVKAVAESDD